MNAIKKVYLVGIILSLIMVRPFAPGDWFGSIAFAGLLTAWLDIMTMLWNNNLRIFSAKAKERYAIVFVVFSLIGFVFITIIIGNLIFSYGWLNEPIVLDELTLVTLLICLSQNTIVEQLNTFINN